MKHLPFGHDAEGGGIGPAMAAPALENADGRVIFRITPRTGILIYYNIRNRVDKISTPCIG
jgi:hypothetical protein